MRYDRKTVRVLPLSDQFLNPELVYTPGGLDKFLVGLATQPAQKFDNIITEEVTNHLFQAKDKEFGMDLISLNLQRGRDHGLQGYNAFRELCGFGRAEKFSQLSDLIPVKIVERLKLIYADVDDVDLFIGGISEAAAVGSLLGPTFQVFKHQTPLRQNYTHSYFSSASLGISSRGFSTETGEWLFQTSEGSFCFIIL